MEYYGWVQHYSLPHGEYSALDNEPYLPFFRFARKSRYQMQGARGRYFPASGQIDLLDDAHDETDEVLMHEAGHARNPNASESDIRQNTRNKLKNSIWH